MSSQPDSYKTAPTLGEFLVKSSIRVKLIIFLPVIAVISYSFMLNFHNKAECERLEPKHVVCQQYKTSFDRAKSIFWRKSSADSLINYRLISTEVKPHNRLYLQTDRGAILYVYEPTEYQEKIPPRVNQVENFIWGQGNSKLVLYLDNSRDRQMLLYYLWIFPTVFLFIAEMNARNTTQSASK